MAQRFRGGGQPLNRSNTSQNANKDFTLATESHYGVQKKAFTLAEVLITLTILGVVAAIAVPNMIRNYNDRADVAKIKRAFAIISNAYEMAVIENGPVSQWKWPSSRVDYQNNEYCTKIFSKYIGAFKYCDNNQDDECKQYSRKNLQGEPTTDNVTQTMILEGGMLFACNPYQKDSVRIVFDINGTKEPNRMGYDNFAYTPPPKGKLFSDALVHLKGESCHALGPYTAGNGMNGDSCLLWILKKGNMDYKYKDIRNKW